MSLITKIETPVRNLSAIIQRTFSKTLLIGLLKPSVTLFLKGMG